MQVAEAAERVAEAARQRRPKGRRLLIALAGPPGGGKTTLAEAVADRLPAAAVMPMDGFHLDNRLLEPAGLLPRKGAPETFDAAGFVACLARVATEDTVYLPVFDRTREIAIAGAARIGPETRTVVVEGNYLCLAEHPWDALAPLWDLAVFLDVPSAELERRLLERWATHGYGPEAAQAKAEGNDLPNARRVMDGRGPVDLILNWSA